MGLASDRRGQTRSRYWIAPRANAPAPYSSAQHSAGPWNLRKPRKWGSCTPDARRFRDWSPSRIRSSAVFRSGPCGRRLQALTEWGEPLSGHVCPIHDGLALAQLAAGAHGHGGAVHSAGHGVPLNDAAPTEYVVGHSSEGQPGTPNDQAPPPHSCRCLGMCCAAIHVITPISAVALSVTTTTVETAVVAPAVPVAESGNSDVVLPFSIGPPSQA